ncbi:desiccation-related protein PCC13-62-like [Hibiscus syriacus]|uniref:desiccation-related protein PCC13-62-like n=1 Tax=Hibiscus syriacus TaxID=106335 RepID=UPI001923A507|nr:desiccation-related protein PCC13-62-like [Hibiscus syriacus]
MATRSCLCAFLLLFAFQSPIVRANTVPLPPPQCRPLVASNLARIEFFVQLLKVKTEFFLRSIGLQIKNISPGLVQGPDPIGATNATVNILTRRIIEQFDLSNVRRIRAIVNRTLLNAPLQRPLITVTPAAFAMALNARIFLLAVRFILSVITQYEGTMTPLIVGTNKRQTVGNLTNITAEGVNVRGRCGAKDEGMIVPLQLGAENRTTVNVVPGDVNSLAVARTTREVLRILYGTGNATMPGALIPAGFTCSLISRILLQNLG